MTTRKNTFLLKRSNVPGKVPSPGDLQMGELALNTADVILYTSGTTANQILPIGWDRLSTISGGTVNGNIISTGYFSGTTFYGDGSNLTGIPDYYVTGGTYSNGTLTLDRQNGSVVINGFSTGGTGTDTYVTGFTYNNANKLTISQNNGQPDLNVYLNTFSGLTVNGDITATSYYGDGSNLTGIVVSWDGLQVITVGEDVNEGDLLFLSGDSRYYKVNNLLESKSSTELRIALTGMTSGSTGSGLIQGQFTTTGLLSGEKYWVGSSGNFTTTLPTADNSIVRYVGTALSTTVLEFNPDQTWIEISSQSDVPITGSTNPSIRSISTSQTALANDETIVCTSTLTLTIPTAVGVAGKIYTIKSRTTGTVTVNTTGGQTIDDDTSLSITIKNTSITIQSDGSNWIII